MSEERRILRALIEAVLAYDHPDFPGIPVERVEARILASFPLDGLRPLLLACAAFASAPLAARRAHLLAWSRSDDPDRRRAYVTLKAVVLMPAYGLPELRAAIGAP